MKIINNLITLIIFFYIMSSQLLASYQNTIESKDQPEHELIIGYWGGILEVAGIDLRIVFKISKIKEDSFNVKVINYTQEDTDSPVSNVKYANVKFSNFKFANDTLRFEVKDVMGTFEGKANEDYSRIEGQWQQSGLNLPLIMIRGEIFKSKPTHQFYLVAAYFIIWIALLIYIWNLLKKQKNFAREIELLKSEVRKNR